MREQAGHLLDNFTALQEPLWHTVSVTASESAGGPLRFESPLVTQSPPMHLYAELQGPAIVVQFHLASTPENPQVVLIPGDAAAEFAASLLDKDVPEMNEDLATELRPVLESIVQGICLGISQLRGEPFIASGVTVRYQVFSFTPNLQVSDTVTRTALTWRTESAQGPMTWLVDEATLVEIVPSLQDPEEAETFSGGSIPATDGTSALAPQPAPQFEPGIEILLDVPLDITAELGRVRMQVKEVLELGTGSLVELDRAAGEPVDVLVNGRVVAKGEVVVIEDNFGVRLTEILSPIERLKKLGERE